MRKFIVALLITLILLNAVSGLALADGMIMPEAFDTGYLVVRYHHVTVDIEDQHAVTRVEQEFVNPHDFPVTGQYVFPVPPNAMVSEFQATFGDQQQTVTRQDVAATNRMLYALVAERHDPSLLQYADWETLVFDLHLPAGASRKMTLEYEEVLLPVGGMMHYRYILSTERYSAKPLEDASVTVNVHVSRGLGTIYSSSHQVISEHLGDGRARVRWEAQNVHPYEDFDLYFSPAEGGFSGGLLSGWRDEEASDEGLRHFLFLFAPEYTAAQENTLPKDLVFVLDRSGSMSGEKIEQARNALHFILGQLNERDRFSIIGFDDQLMIFSETLQPADKDGLRAARRFVDELYANNNTDIEAALQAGLRIFEESEPRQGASRLIVFLTDGLPTAGITDPALIAELVGRSNARIEARLHVFGVGYDVNTHLLDQLSAENSGSVTYVQPGENLEFVLATFYGKIANPVLTDLEIDFEGMEVMDVYPQSLPDMFQGSSLLLSGRYRSTSDGPVTARVRGWAGADARVYVYNFDLNDLPDQDFVSRLWATRRIGDLLDQVRVEGESAARIEEIRELGLAYGLVTPYTTFVIASRATGAASASNMALYDRPSDLNRASGQTTIQARVQNQMYQEAAQANLASGANIINSGSRSLAQVSRQNIDLSLLQDRADLAEPLTDRWIAAHIDIDRQVDFGSEAYFTLANDPAARQYLQSGNNVLFVYRGEVIQVWDETYEPEDVPTLEPQDLNVSVDNTYARVPQLPGPLPDADVGRSAPVRSVVWQIVTLLQSVWERIAP